MISRDQGSNSKPATYFWSLDKPILIKRLCDCLVVQRPRTITEARFAEHERIAREQHDRPQANCEGLAGGRGKSSLLSGRAAGQR